MASNSPEDDGPAWEKFDPCNEEHIRAVIARQVELTRAKLNEVFTPCEKRFADAHVHKLYAAIEQLVRRDCAELARAMQESEAARATRH
jgi:hypothetical protein